MPVKHTTGGLKEFEDKDNLAALDKKLGKHAKIGGKIKKQEEEEESRSKRKKRFKKEQKALEKQTAEEEKLEEQREKQREASRKYFEELENKPPEYVATKPVPHKREMNRIWKGITEIFFHVRYCDICEKKLTLANGRRCTYCEKYHCEKHSFPEEHGCEKLPKKNPYIDNQPTKESLKYL